MCVGGCSVIIVIDPSCLWSWIGLAHCISSTFSLNGLRGEAGANGTKGPPGL